MPLLTDGERAGEVGCGEGSEAGSEELVRLSLPREKEKVEFDLVLDKAFGVEGEVCGTKGVVERGFVEDVEV